MWLQTLSFYLAKSISTTLLLFLLSVLSSPSSISTFLLYSPLLNLFLPLVCSSILSSPYSPFRLPLIFPPSSHVFHQPHPLLTSYSHSLLGSSPYFSSPSYYVPPFSRSLSFPLSTVLSLSPALSPTLTPASRILSSTPPSSSLPLWDTQLQCWGTSYIFSFDEIRLLHLSVSFLSYFPFLLCSTFHLMKSCSRGTTILSLSRSPYLSRSVTIPFLSYVFFLYVSLYISPPVFHLHPSSLQMCFASFSLSVPILWNWIWWRWHIGCENNNKKSPLSLKFAIENIYAKTQFFEPHASPWSISSWSMLVSVLLPTRRSKNSKFS